MAEKTVPYLCGGTFYILVLQALKKGRKERYNDLDGYRAKVQSPNEINVLKGLVRIYYDEDNFYSDNTFSGNRTEYKMCRMNSSGWLAFENQSLIDEFDKKVKGSYEQAMSDMDAFLDTYIDKGKRGEKLVRALLEVLNEDRTIPVGQTFFLGGREISKKRLLEKKSIDAGQFLLAIWHFIIVNRGKKNIDGSATVEQWLQKKKDGETHDKYTYAGHVGEKYALDVKIDFNKDDCFSDADETVDTDEESENNAEDGQPQDAGSSQTVNNILNTNTVFVQKADQIFNIGHIDHLEI